jgi:hypothetical protein
MSDILVVEMTWRESCCCCCLLYYHPPQSCSIDWQWAWHGMRHLVRQDGVLLEVCDDKVTGHGVVAGDTEGDWCWWPVYCSYRIPSGSVWWQSNRSPCLGRRHGGRLMLMLCTSKWWSETDAGAIALESDHVLFLIGQSVYITSDVCVCVVRWYSVVSLHLNWRGVGDL